MTGLRQTWQVSLRYFRVLLRQPAFLLITIVQPLIWLLLVGPLFLVAALLAAAFASLSNGIGVLARQRESLIGAVSLLLLPLTFLSGALMQLSLAPGWIRTVAKFNPVDWAVVGARDADVVRLGLLGALVVVS